MELTERENEIAYYSKLGYSQFEIAEKLSISPNTVKRYLTTIHRKLNIEFTKDLVYFDFKEPKESDEKPSQPTQEPPSFLFKVSAENATDSYFVQLLSEENKSVYLKVKGNLNNFVDDFTDYISKQKMFNDFLSNYEQFQNFLSYKNEFLKWEKQENQKKAEFPKDLF